MAIDLSGKVAIVTGAGGGLGREHALALAAHGARVVVNDLGGGVDGTGGSLSAAAKVVEEIKAKGGEAIANSASVTDFDAITDMVDHATGLWGGVDILVANAGILRDKSFAKMEIDDFRAVFEVHVMGSVNCAKAVWQGMRERNYGRIIFTTSSSGLYGNFGQSNYGAAKMALVGLMNTLAIEGEKYNIRVNCLAPSAATRMLEGLLPADQLAALAPDLVSPAVIAMASDAAPTKTTICAGAGSFEAAHITLTQGLAPDDGNSPAESILANLAELTGTDRQQIPTRGWDQIAHELAKAGFKTAEGA